MPNQNSGFPAAVGWNQRSVTLTNPVVDSLIISTLEYTKHTSVYVLHQPIKVMVKHQRLPGKENRYVIKSICLGD
jgi:hypothetical protein